MWKETFKNNVQLYIQLLVSVTIFKAVIINTQIEYRGSFNSQMHPAVCYTISVEKKQNKSK